MKKIENVTFSDAGNKSWEEGVIYLNNRSLTSDSDYVVSFQGYDHIIATAMLTEVQVVELIKNLELLLATKND